jgi:ParB family chromosome partitioning protein
MMNARTKGLKLSGLLDSGAIPKADPAVIARMPMLAEPELQNLPHREISIALIDPSPFQPRLRFGHEELVRLADSIKEGTLSDPVSVREKADGRYELISGERRWRAHQFLDVKTIPAVLRSLDDRQSALIAIASNTVREDLTDFELGRCFKKTLDCGHVQSVAELSKVIGLSRQQIDRCLDFMKLPDEAINKLEHAPNCFGANCAEFFAGYVKKGHGDAVVAAVNLIVEEGYTEQKAMAWLRGFAAPEIPKKKKRPANVPLFYQKKQVGNAYLDRRKVVIDCHDGVKPAELLDLVRGFFNGGPA